MSIMSKCLCSNRFRFIILFLSTLCLTMLLSNVLTINFSMMCMKTSGDFKNSSYIHDNESHQIDIYNQMEKSLLYSSAAIGAVITVYPLIFLLNYFGTRVVLTFVGLLSAFATFAIPFVVEIGIHYVILLRLLQGIGFAAVITAIGTITSTWSPLVENGIFISILSEFMHLAPIISMPIAGLFCGISMLSWPAIYYFHGIVTAVLFTLFGYFYRDNCKCHANVSKSEYEYIVKGKSLSQKKPKLPYRAMLTSVPVWAVWIAAIGNFFGLQLLLQFTPIYMHHVLGYSVSFTGYASAAPQIVAFFAKIFAGIASDRIEFCSELTKLRFFNTISVAGMGVSYMALGLFPNTQKGSFSEISYLLLAIANICIAFNGVAFLKSAQRIARHNASFIMGNMSLIVCIAMLTVPYIVQYFAADNHRDQWSHVFLFHAVLMIGANAIFCLFASGNVQKWALTEMQPHGRNMMMNISVISDVQKNCVKPMNAADSVFHK